MNPEQKAGCRDFSSLLVKKITGGIIAQEKRTLDSHLTRCPSCAIEERELIAIFQKLDSPPNPEIPTELFENTRQMILGKLKREKSWFARFAKIPMTGPWQGLVPATVGLAMTAISYGLIHRLINPSSFHPFVLVSFFAVWWILFTAGCWSILKDKGGVFFPLSLVSASSISITLLSLLVASITFELEAVRWGAVPVAYEIAHATDYLFGMGDTLVAAWWLHCCLASFVGAFIFGVSRFPRSSENLLVSSFVVMILLSPAIYLQGASHNHGLGIIAFAAAGTYVGSMIGTALGLFIRRKLSFQVA